MTDPGAVFISYASDDRDAALKICNALRAQGIEVWFDQSELRGGDAWDNKIRTQIRTCFLFLVVISRNAIARDEGYFRLEWKLAIDRSHHMSVTRSFIVPVAIDDTPESSVSLPDRFRDYQWTRLPEGVTSAAFVQHVQRILARGNSAENASRDQSSSRPDTKRRHPLPKVLWVASALTVLGLGVFCFWYFETHQGFRVTPAATKAVGSPALDFNPPAHSVAVLPFANLSGDASQEYFSDGLSEEILDALSRLAGIRVVARSSSFSFKGKGASILDMGRQLNVASILEGSVRRAGSQVRISAHLIESATGFELWSQSYDRELKDILALQTDIASAVTQKLKVTLTQNFAELVEEGGTHNPNALDLFYSLRTAKPTQEGFAKGIEISSEAIRLDPNYAKAYILRAQLELIFAVMYDPIVRVQSRYADVRADLERALAIVPQSAMAHAIYTDLLCALLDFPGALRESTLARKFAPTLVFEPQVRLSSLLARHREAIDDSLRVIARDPLSAPAYEASALAYFHSGDLDRALLQAEHVNSIDPEFAKESLCRINYALHRYQLVIDGCPESDDVEVMVSRLLALDALHRANEANLLLKKIMTENGDAAAYQYAEIYAVRGETAKSLDWLEKAYQQRDPGLEHLQIDTSLDSLRQQPRFRAILDKLKFPPSTM